MRKFPGPKYLAISKIPTLRFRVKGVLHWKYAEWHAKYGPVVRVGPNHLSYIDPQAWKDIHGHRAAGKAIFDKDPKMYGSHLGSPGSDLVRANDEAHSRQRRIFSHAFSDKALREQEGLIKGYVMQLITKLHEKAQYQAKFPNERGVFDMIRMYNFTTFDIMSDLTFGESLGMLDRGDYVPWVTNVFGGIKVANTLSPLWAYTATDYLTKKILPLFNSKSESHKQFSKERVDKRLQKDIDRGDIWSLVMRGEELDNISRAEMYSNASSFMVGGTETTATLLSGLTWLLCMHPDKMQRLLKEIRAFKSLEELNILNLQRLSYLHACIEEALRLYPPIPLSASRVAPEGGAIVCGQFVPGGVSNPDVLLSMILIWSHQTQASIAPGASFQSSLNFADPLEFVPERFLPNLPKRYANDKLHALQPFSFGPRNCLGKK